MEAPMLASSALAGDDGADVLSSIETLLRSAHDPDDHEAFAAEKSGKKHSGPRKRRPKKKASVAPRSSATPPPICVDTQRDAVRDEEAARLKAALRASATPFVPVSPPAFHHLLDPPFTELSLSPPPLVYVSPPAAYAQSFSLRPPPFLMGPAANEVEQQQRDRAYWTQFVIDAAEKERERRLSKLRQMQREEEEEIQRRRAWAIAAIEQEQQAMMREMFLDNMKNTQWFQSTITRLDHDYEVVCPNSWFGCTFSCMLKDLEAHVEHCEYRQVPDTLDQVGDETVAMDLYTYDVVCPNAMLGCSAIFPREELATHLASCPVSSMTREQEWQERQEWQQSVIELTEEERQRRMDEHRGQEDRFSFSHLQRLYEEQTAMMHVVLHEEIVRFTSQCQTEAEHIRPAIEVAIARIERVIEDIWGSGVRVETYGSFATQLHGGHSDVDLVVFGATGEKVSEGVGISTIKCMSSQECVSTLAEHLSASTEGPYESISAITRASIPLVKVIVTVEIENGEKESEVHKIPFDITFDDPRDSIHNGVASASLLQTLLLEFYGLRELTLVLKHFLATRGLNDPYVGGLSSYGLVLMILFILREQGALVKLPKGEIDCVVVDENVSVSTNKPSSRYEAQKLKGVTIGKEIIRQARVRQSVLMATAMNEPKANKRRNGAAAWEVLMKEAPPSQPTNSRSSPHKSRFSEPYLLGKLLMDFLQWYGTDFRHTFDQITVLSCGDAGITSPKMVGAASLSPNHRPHPASVSPTFQASLHEVSLMIQDPLQSENNVGKTCYRISQVLRDFSDFLSVLTALIVRGSVMVPGTATVPETADVANEPAIGKRARSSSSQRILSSVFQMKQAPVTASSSARARSSSTS